MLQSRDKKAFFTTICLFLEVINSIPLIFKFLTKNNNKDFFKIFKKMELQVDLLDEINFRQVERQKAFSWETHDETTSNPPQICASECTLFPFAPEICTESLLPNRDKITARIVKNESDLVMDFAFLLCGWESRSILIHSNNFFT